MSQGIVFPISVLPGVLYEDEDSIVLTDMVNVGTDVSDVLGIVKWELPEDLGGRSVQGMRTVTRPDFIPKTDETRVQNLGGLVKQCAGMSFVATEKLDGSSFTAFLKNGEFGICSRNQRLDPTDMTHAFCALAKRLEIEAKMRAAGDDFVIQGEVIGPKIQGNKYKLPNCDLYVFDVFDLASNEYVSHHNMVPFVAEMGLQTVPFVQMVNLPDSVDAIVAMSEGKSALSPHVEREGIVLRPVGIMKNDRGERVSFKAINPKFLLKYEE